MSKWLPYLPKKKHKLANSSKLLYELPSRYMYLYKTHINIYKIKKNTVQRSYGYLICQSTRSISMKAVEKEKIQNVIQLICRVRPLINFQVL